MYIQLNFLIVPNSWSPCLCDHFVTINSNADTSLFMFSMKTESNSHIQHKDSLLDYIGIATVT